MEEAAESTFDAGLDAVQLESGRRRATEYGESQMGVKALTEAAVALALSRENYHAD